MSKIVVVNGSPRKNWNTAKLLKEALRGAEELGAETKYYDLYDYNYKGCVSCFACKRKNAKTNGLCAFRDELTPILQDIQTADALLAGSPVYYSYPTGMFRSFLERLMYPLGTYLIDETKTEFALKRILNKTVPVGIIITMNCPENMAKDWNYPAVLNENEKSLNSIFGYAETLYAYDTFQFPDYSKYDCTLFNENDKIKSRDTIFPEDMHKAFELGKRLIKKIEK